MSLVKKILNTLNTKYLNIFYKTIRLEKDASIDYRCEIEQKNNISIGKKSILYKNITIYKHTEGKLQIGDFSHIAPYGYFLIEKQNLTIGDNVAIGSFCSIFCSTNAIPEDKEVLLKDSYIKGDVQIGNNVLIGTHCVILPHTVIGDDVVIAANSTVKGQLQNGFLYGGNPAKKIKALGHE
ncbi:MAG: acyltransferase [Bacteroidales bacterium]|nr:acyltransferase [Bacteroidales bacterium]